MAYLGCETLIQMSAHIPNRPYPVAEKRVKDQNHDFFTEQSSEKHEEKISNMISYTTEVNVIIFEIYSSCFFNDISVTECTCSLENIPCT